MKMKKHIAAIIALGLLSLGACKKDEAQQQDPPPSKREILIAAPWTLTHVQEQMYLNDSLVNDEVEFVQASVTFTKDNYVIAKMHGEPDDTSGFAFSGDKFFLDQMEYEVETLNNEKFVFSHSMDGQQGADKLVLKETFYLSRNE